jgi:phosphoheptose isomerase
MSKINKITKVFTKTVTALVKEGDRLNTLSTLQKEVADIAAKKAVESLTESKRAYNIAAKIQGVLN